MSLYLCIFQSLELWWADWLSGGRCRGVCNVFAGGGWEATWYYKSFL